MLLGFLWTHFHSLSLSLDPKLCFSGLSPRPSFLLIPWSLLMASSILIASNTIYIWDFNSNLQQRPSFLNIRSNLIQLSDCHTHMDISGATLIQYTQMILLILKFFLHLSPCEEIVPPNIYLLPPEPGIYPQYSISSFPSSKPTLWSNPVPGSISKTFDLFISFHNTVTALVWATNMSGLNNI